MPYKKPGAYARFIQTAAAVNAPGATRVMALVGTGTLFYKVTNETVVRDNNSVADVLANENIFEVQALYNKPLRNGQIPADAITFKQFDAKKPTDAYDYKVVDGKYIVWSTTGNPTVAKASDNNADFASKVTVAAIAGSEHLIKDGGQYKVEISYIDADLGSFRVTDLETYEIMGEFGVTNGDNTKAINNVAIPGVKLIVEETLIKDALDPDKVLTELGDYVIVETHMAAVKTASVVDGTTPLPVAGDAFYVNYTHKKPDADLKPKVFYDYDDIVAEYGNYDVTATGKVINSIALGAEIAFLNGVNPVVCVQSVDDSPYEMIQALKKLEKPVPGINNFNTIVPLSTHPDVKAAAVEHVTRLSSSQFGKERMVYLAADTIKDSGQLAEEAAGYDNERVVFVVPGGATKDVRDIYTGRVSTKKIPGSFVAIAVAALGLKNDPAEPLTNKTITGFGDLAELYDESEMDIMAENGCLIVTQRGSNLIVRHGLTTSTAEVNSSEITLIQIKDYVIDACRSDLAEIYVGRKLKPQLVGDVQVSLTSILDQFKALDIIVDYSGVVVKRSTDDPRQIDIRFEIEAMYPLNYISIEFSFSQV
jgi:hypothetical protein